MTELEDALSALRRGADRWPATPARDRARLLSGCRDGLERVKERWMRACLRAKGLERGSPGAGEEWMTLGVVFRVIRHLRRSLLEIAEDGKPRLPGPVREGTDGRPVVEVFPRSRTEGLLFRNTSAEVWLRRSASRAGLRREQARRYRSADRMERRRAVPVCLVLGAGNAASLPVTDSLSKLVGEDRVVLLKMSPVNGYLGPILEKAFRPLIDVGALRIVYGGAEEGERLATHDAVEEIHLTGSDRTYEAVVFGPGEDGRRRKRRGEPRLRKPVTAELGNVTPVIVVPGPWSETDFTYHSRQLASWLVTNAGFNCVTPRVLVQHRGNSGRLRLLNGLELALSRVETRAAYYPGAEERYREFTAGREETVEIGDGSGDRLPWTLVPGLDPEADAGDPCFREEAFCGLMCETALEAPDTPTFLDRAVEFANERLWGTLAAALLVHPDSLEDPRVGDAVERAVRDLRYGTVCVNARAEFGYLLATTAWGAYPGSRPTDIQSGTGRVNNALMLPDVEKNVVRGPFRRPKDPFLVTSGVLNEFGRKYVGWEARPGPVRTASLLWTALRA